MDLGQEVGAIVFRCVGRKIVKILREKFDGQLVPPAGSSEGALHGANNLGTEVARSSGRRIESVDERSQ
jgi:hypothetical protein